MFRLPLLIVLIAFPVAAVHAATLVVYPGGQGLHPGIQPAIDATLQGDTVLVMPGTYRGPLNRDLDFLGKDICVLGFGGPDSVIIDCEYSGRGFYLHSGETRAALICGVHVTRGGGDHRLTGGGIRCESSSPTIEGVIITQSNTSNSGGILCLYSSPLILNSLISDNTVDVSASGLDFGYSDSAVVKNTTIMSNWGGGYGGGVNVTHSTASFDSVFFIGNYASQGGGLYSWDSDITITDCTFDGNEARYGAGIYESESSLQIRDCAFTANYASIRGAALHFEESGDILVEDCDFFGSNAASGAIITLTYSSSPTLRRLSIVGNNHGDAIGAWCCYTAGVVEDCVIAFNQGGYGIRENPAGLSWLSLSCTNVFGNEFGEYSDENYTGQNGNISLDPLFCDPTFATFGLAQESPCLPANNDCGVLMGNHGSDCTLTALTPAADAGDRLAAYPNPFNPKTTFRFTQPDRGQASLRIYDVAGREVATLLDGVHPGGQTELSWHAEGLAGGIYLARLEAAGIVQTERLVLLK